MPRDINPVEVISAKRWGRKLSATQIRQMIEGFQQRRIPRRVMAAWAMAICTQGMDEEETQSLTEAMWQSGATLEWPPGKPKVDKHSTGGIGDKISIPLAPILACLGMDVPMISGRSLGFTGGTLDKLASIPGYRADLTIKRFQRVVRSVGCSIVGASRKLARADRRLYQLRDETGTVESVALITASILSKKLAAGLDCLILDVKWGSGAFMPELERARELAQSLVRVGQTLGLRIRALLTDMNQPLGRMVGNAVEIDESLAVLRGEGPDDVTELTVRLAVELLDLAGLERDATAARSQVLETIVSGRAEEKLRAMVAAHGGDLEAPRARHRAQDLVAEREGVITGIDGREIGYTLNAIGGGRIAADDRIDPGIGFEMLVRIGETVQPGQLLGRLFYDGDAQLVRERLARAIGIGDEATSPPVLVHEVLS